MDENLDLQQYIIQIQEPMEANRLVADLANLGIQVDSQFTSLEQVGQPMFINDVQLELLEELPQNDVFDAQETPCVYQIVFPHELNLNPVNTTLRRGRPPRPPKKMRLDEDLVAPVKSEEESVKVKTKVSRTRSGRVVKPPKHIDYKKFEVAGDEEEVKVTDFESVTEPEPLPTQIEFQEITANQKKRVISNQYKCPKCSKAYLGRRKIIQHLTKNPDHGPFPEVAQNKDFNLWNYLFDITQKCRTGQKGIKFCQELSNMLNNIMTLKNTLFKAVDSNNNNKNCVDVDKVLGNAIGLTPGKYKFDENELFKDVGILKLITSTDFLKSNNENVKVKNEVRDIPETITSEIGSDHCDGFLDIGVKLCDDEGANLLETTSTNSDDVMNVDQFVNERFKKIVGPDLEITSLELPLDLFHFSNS